MTGLVRLCLFNGVDYTFFFNVALISKARRLYLLPKFSIDTVHAAFPITSFSPIDFAHMYTRRVND
jgi:hypothetical protein